MRNTSPFEYRACFLSEWERDLKVSLSHAITMKRALKDQSLCGPYEIRARINLFEVRVGERLADRSLQQGVQTSFCNIKRRMFVIIMDKNYIV